MQDTAPSCKRVPDRCRNIASLTVTAVIFALELTHDIDALPPLLIASGCASQLGERDLPPGNRARVSMISQCVIGPLFLSHSKS